MKGLAYLGCLLVSLAGVATLDWRHRLCAWVAPTRTAVVLALGVGFFLAWDVAGIAAGVFFRGNTQWMTGWVLAPELPVEEPFFLLLLCYCTLVMWAGVSRWVARTDSKTDSKAESRLDTLPQPEGESPP